jgi:hypothetical protein
VCGARASEHAAGVEDADRLTPSHTFALAHPLDDATPPGRSPSSAGCRRRDAAAKRGSGRSGHGRPAEPRRQGCGGRERARWWRGAGSFAVTPTSDDRYGWSGVESWRNGALTDSQQHSQDYSQQCSQTSSRHAAEGSARSGSSQQHSQDYSQQHSQALVTAL